MKIVFKLLPRLKLINSKHSFLMPFPGIVIEVNKEE